MTTVTARTGQTNHQPAPAFMASSSAPQVDQKYDWFCLKPSAPIGGASVTFRKI